MSATASKRHALITGGAGFIGANLAQRLLEQGQRVVLLDNLSRPGVERNVEWLRSAHGDRVELVREDTRHEVPLRELVAAASQVFHFAAQVAVTTSLMDPLADFDTNARGTLNVLEALRQLEDPPPFVYTSTNKVYGALDDVELVVRENRYEPAHAALGMGISEQRPLDFYSPYGCSKGAADQYTIDYARSFGLPAVVYRMSCIYGPRQFGNEDQGWVAHFMLRALRGQAITIYGDGLQVRDLLYVDDLVDALLLGRDHARELAGAAYNVGGGSANTLSLLELLDEIHALVRRAPQAEFEPPRVGDQRWYVSDHSELSRRTGWRPKVHTEQGLPRLLGWLESLLTTPRAESRPRFERARQGAAR
jgi:CDP-paratose 2-epimerase